jgi:hypothetical protein
MPREQYKLILYKRFTQKFPKRNKYLPELPESSSGQVVEGYHNHNVFMLRQAQHDSLFGVEESRYSNAQHVGDSSGKPAARNE